MNNRGAVKKIIFIVLILIILAVAVYFSFFFYYKCDDVACFKSHQEKCSKTKFLNNIENAEWQYKINGKKDGQCEINVKIKRINKGDVDKLALEGKSMGCLLPMGSINSPESDISNCHGELREEIQGLIIQKLHNYIVKNLGKIEGELNNIQNAGKIINENTQTTNSSAENQTNNSSMNKSTTNSSG